MWGDIAIAFLLAFITSFVITPYTIKFAKKIGAVDTPKDERRINTKTMPRLRWLSGNFRLSYINDISSNHYEHRGLYRIMAEKSNMDLS